MRTTRRVTRSRSLKSAHSNQQSLKSVDASRYPFCYVWVSDKSVQVGKVYLNGVSAAAAVLRALSAEREVKERCPVISWGRSARQENIRRGGSIELSGPQQRWSA